MSTVYLSTSCTNINTNQSLQQQLQLPLPPVSLARLAKQLSAFNPEDFKIQTNSSAAEDQKECRNDGSSVKKDEKEIVQQEKREHRKNVVIEILETEQAYINGLILLQNVLLFFAM